MHIAAALLGIHGGEPGGSAGAVPPNKGVYGLGNPTPRHLMRPLSADRPDTTESPYTVDAGHIQIELSFAEWTRKDDGPRTDTVDFLPINIKLGITNSDEVQLVISPYSVIEEDGGARTAGPGDTAIRFKHNFWGNDSDGTALAIMPFISLPTGASGISADRIEGGFILPFAMELPAGFSLGLMAELDFVWNDDGTAYDLDFVHTAVLGHDLVGDLAGFVEYVGAASSDSETDYRATANLGLTLGLGPDVQLDGGVELGLTEAADDLRVYLGMTVRF